MNEVFLELYKNPSAWSWFDGPTASGIRSRRATGETTPDIAIVLREPAA